MKWVSWVQKTEDYRPLHDPPNDDVIGWWCSGYDSNDNAILVAFLNVNSDLMAVKAIRKDWPELEEWRFIQDCDSEKPSDRFPLEGWSLKRFEALARRRK